MADEAKWIRGGGKIVAKCWTMFELEYRRYYPDKCADLAKAIGETFEKPKSGLTSKRLEENKYEPRKAIKVAKKDQKDLEKVVSDKEAAGDRDGAKTYKRYLNDAIGREKTENRREGQYAVEGLKHPKSIHRKKAIQLLANTDTNEGRNAWNKFKKDHKKEGYDLYIKEVFDPELRGERGSTGQVYKVPHTHYGKDADLFAKFITSAYVNTKKYGDDETPYSKAPTAGSG